MGKLCNVIASAWLALVVWSPLTASANNQQPLGLNLGGTSFLDGFGPPEGGFTYQVYLTGSTSSTLRDAGGDKVLAFRDPRISTAVLLNQLTYFLPQTLFDGSVRPGINLLVPFVMFDTSFGGPGPALTDNRFGLGDLTIGPLFQFTPIMVDGRPVFSHRLAFDVIVPVGSYDPSKNLNQSSHFVSFNPSWAATVVPLPRLEISVRLYYLYNATNDRPINGPPGVMLDRARAGQAVWSNFAASYEILHGLHVGANGYYFKQLSADSYRLADGTTTDGEKMGEGKAQVLGMGPGVMWQPDQGDFIYVNLYFQRLVEARAESTSLNLRWLHTF
jgi:hypothetical protein